jgi:hypothetical protein
MAGYPVYRDYILKRVRCQQFAHGQEGESLDHETQETARKAQKALAADVRMKNTAPLSATGAVRIGTGHLFPQAGDLAQQTQDGQAEL